MTASSPSAAKWPALPLAAWRDTYATLHMWSQIVGKLCLALTAPVNHYWNVAFRLTARGLSTQPLAAGTCMLTILFDFVDHALVLACSDGRREVIPLEPQTVAAFYAEFMRRLARLDVAAHIWTMPVEIPDPIRFEADEVHRSYDRACVNAFWRALVSMQPVLERFRGGFVGKCSPVHFFWGSFDLAVTRFSGERAPERPGADRITREAYSHAVISHGFWPGGGAIDEAVFYAYAVPEPAGLRDARVEPEEAYYSRDLNEFLLPYDAVRTAPSPEAALSRFLETTYDRAAALADWNRRALER